jgi:hypothetical protein
MIELLTIVMFALSLASPPIVVAIVLWLVLRQ